MIECTELIVTNLTKKGKGTHILSPVRAITEVYTKSGSLIAIHDSQGNFSIEDMASFGSYCQVNGGNNIPVEKLFQEWKASPSKP